ncbi:hypothetical protein BRD13_00310 [Halobacteriales archaeon SW_5_70_135]|nr:MAG: hypothetical protein BRD13_00310 [Halobacteriales archaeon SW_5_70_135]
MTDDAPDRSPAAAEALHTTLDCSFEEAVDRVRVLGEAVTRTALVVVCHAEVARDAVDLDPVLGGLLPCTTAVYEQDGEVHVHHLSATKAMRDLGCVDADDRDAMADLVELTGERMRTVWENVEAIDASYGAEPAG